MDKSLETAKKKLLDLGYFKYVKDKDLQTVINKTFENYCGDGFLNFPWEGLNRVSSIDAEDICECGGFFSRTLFQVKKSGQFFENFEKKQVANFLAFRKHFCANVIG